MSFSIAPRTRQLLRLGISGIKAPSPNNRAFFPSLQPSTKPRNNLRLLHSGQNPPKTYFAPPPQFQEPENGVKPARLWLVAAVSSVWIYYMYSHIEIIPATGRKRLNLLSENNSKKISATRYGALELTMAILALEKVVFKETSTQDDEQVHRVNHILQHLLINNGHDPRNWNICVIDVPRSFTSTVNRVPHHLVIDLKTLSSYTDNNELAFQLARQIALSEIRPLVDRYSLFQCLLITLPVVWGSAFVLQKPRTLATLLAAAAVTPVGLYSYLAALSEVDSLGMTIMAKAGYDPRAAIEIAKKEDRRTFRPNMVDETGKERLSSRWMQRRVKMLEKQLPIALAHMPAEPVTFQSATTPYATSAETPTQEPAAGPAPAASNPAPSDSTPSDSVPPQTAKSDSNDPPADDSHS